MKKTLILTLLLTTLAAAFVSADAYTLYDPSYLYTKDGDNLKWLATIDAGTKFSEVLDVDVPAKINNKNNERKNEYFKVRYNGKEAWILASGIVKDEPKISLGSRAVVTKDAAVYTWNDVASFEHFSLPVGTVVIMATNDDYEDNGLKKVFIFDDKVFWRIRSVFIKSNRLSLEQGDYDAVALVKAALAKDASKDTEIIAKLLSSAEDKAESSGIVNYVREKVSEIEGSDISNSGILEFVREADVSSDGSKVNVRDVPGKKGKVVGQLLDGGYVDIYQRTENKETIAGETDYWYHISTPGEDSVDGWVFGSALKIK